jgi:general secretion pathway protein K
VCQASNNTARMCQDANEAQKFLMALMMLQSFMPGLPVFANANEFVSALQQGATTPAAPGQPAAPAAPAAPAGLAGGGSPVAMIMKAMGIEPIPLISVDQTKKSITTESKVFSIYATGYVHSGKRESSVHVHAVVDFRGAPAPGLIQPFGIGTGPGGTPPPNNGVPPTTPNPANSANSANGTPTGIPGVLKPGAGGNIVYYRVD